MIPLLDEIYSKWLVGDSEFVETEMLEQFREFPEFYDKMLRDRNMRWMPSIEEAAGGEQGCHGRGRRHAPRG